MNPGAANTADAAAARPPLLRVVKGDPTPAELAALVAVVATATATGGHEKPSEALSEWAQPERMARQPVFAGPPMSWWASSLPR